MKNFIDTILVMIFLSLGWILFTVLIRVHIRLEAKKRWRKNEKYYPYFHGSIFKKVFLLGLKGALNPSIVVVTFIFNISVLLLVISGTWFLISPNIVVSYIFRGVTGIYGVSFFLKLGLYIACPLKL